MPHLTTQSTYVIVLDYTHWKMYAQRDNPKCAQSVLAILRPTEFQCHQVPQQSAQMEYYFPPHTDGPQNFHNS